MVDTLSKKKRSWVMSQVKSKNTKPEIIVRSLLHNLGYRYRLHDKKLPGNPDIVLRKYKSVIFVHGCFWHYHKNCKRENIAPKTNKKFWMNKFKKNIARDKMYSLALKKLGWKVIVIWECQLKTPNVLKRKIKKHLLLTYNAK